MTPQRARAYAKGVLVPLVTAAVVAWNEHRAAQNRERQDAAYAVTAPALRDLQVEQAKLAARVEVLTRLVAAHVTEHPFQRGAAVAAERPITRSRAGLGAGGSIGRGGGGAAGQDLQVKMAEQLKKAPVLQPAQHSIPESPDEALREVKK